jgi:hypothetical protein
MTNKELSAALRDLDAQMDKFVREHVSFSLSTKEGQAGGVPNFRQASASANSCGGVEGHAGSADLGASAVLSDTSSSHDRLVARNTASRIVGPKSEYQASPAGLRITEAPEPHEPTKVLGWLLVGFAGFCVYVLGATIFKFWDVIVRTLR